ncbi:peptidoglycan DD-metalloendopeptidase family protein [Nocardioides humilatus]|uniref:Peptidoglycan DD-metalloendopeptidase family protein n=1 Tax=Nocardioides humilatus TaxID=2607660 RepID=A0A5B1LCL4_9ACTN|nr:M23 family metallopeptidase [Nocardioides humilatus]KAA1418483.1 peptidoglycan DD-metalloendopeptidase family protein [Nocardioides humilatus]
MRPVSLLLRAVLLPALITLAPVSPAAAGDDPLGSWPLRPQPEVAARFDPPTSTYGAGHRGVDLLGHASEQVLAALPGRVTFAGTLAGLGVVVVSHGDTRTTYQPVAARVSVGDVVAEGAVIGALQPTGSHCAPRVCLHWGWLRDQTYLDPLLLVDAGPVRLLPLWRDLPAAPPPTGSWMPAPLPYARWRPVGWPA